MKYTWEPAQYPRNAVEVVCAGGTISSIVRPDGARMGGQAIDLIGELTDRIPDFEGRFNIGQREIAYTGLSENIEPQTLNDIETKVKEALERDPEGILMTVGTDAMEQIARAMDQRLSENYYKKG